MFVLNRINSVKITTMVIAWYNSSSIEFRVTQKSICQTEIYRQQQHLFTTTSVYWVKQAKCIKLHSHKICWNLL